MITTNYYKRLVNFFENCKNENELKREYVDIKKLFWYFTYENYLPTLHLAVANKENEKDPFAADDSFGSDDPFEM